MHGLWHWLHVSLKRRLWPQGLFYCTPTTDHLLQIYGWTLWHGAKYACLHLAKFSGIPRFAIHCSKFAKLPCRISKFTKRWMVVLIFTFSAEIRLLNWNTDDESFTLTKKTNGTSVEPSGRSLLTGQQWKVDWLTLADEDLLVGNSPSQQSNEPAAPNSFSLSNRRSCEDTEDASPMSTNSRSMIWSAALVDAIFSSRKRVQTVRSPRQSPCFSRIVDLLPVENVSARSKTFRPYPRESHRSI